MYKFRNGYRAAKGLNANAVAEELERIRAKSGALTAPIIVDESEDLSSPLHPAFTWDDGEAAQKYREHQANTLVRSVQLVVPDKKKEPTCLYVLTMKDEQRQYLPLEIVANDADMFDYSIKRLRSVLSGAKKAVDELIASVVKGDVQKRKKISQLQRHVEKATAVAERI